MRRLLVLPVFFGLMAVTALDAQAVFPGKPGRIVFSASGYNGDFFAFTLKDVDPRTKRVRQLTAPSCSGAGDQEYWEDRAPDYSPNGRLIAYLHSDKCPGSEERQGLWVMRADGSKARRVVPVPVFRVGNTYGPSNVSVAFSPEGRRIAVAYDDYSGPNFAEPRTYVDIYSASEGALLARHQRRYSGVGGIDWSSRGRMAVAVGSRIRLLHPDGSRQRTLTAPSATSDWPEWSPSGRTLVYARDETGDECEACFGGGYIMRLRVGDRRAKLRLSGGYFFSPVMSPDARGIAFAEDNVVHVTRAGQRRRRLVRGKPETSIFELDWQPVLR